MTTLAIVLTGGRSRRMGGPHKPALRVGSASIVDRVVHAAREADPSADIVIAGSAAGSTAAHAGSVTVVRDDPPFSGPLSGIAAALSAVPPDPGRAVLILGGDMPFLGADLLGRLVARVADGSPVASTRDASGRLQFLCAAWREDELRERLAGLGPVAGVRLSALYDGAEADLVEAEPAELADVDTPADYARAQAIGDGSHRPPRSSRR